MRRLFGWFVLLVLSLSVGGCNKTGPVTNPRHPAVVASVGIGQALFALDDGERALFTAGKLAPGNPAQNVMRHKAIGLKITAALELGQQANGAILSWRPGQSAPATLKQMLPALQTLTKEIIDLLPGEPSATMLGYVNQVWSAVALVLALMTGGV